MVMLFVDKVPWTAGRIDRVGVTWGRIGWDRLPCQFDRFGGLAMELERVHRLATAIMILVRDLFYWGLDKKG